MARLVSCQALSTRDPLLPTLTTSTAAETLAITGSSSAAEFDYVTFGVPPAGPISAVGSTAEATGTPLSVSPQTVGDLMVLTVACRYPGPVPTVPDRLRHCPSRPARCGSSRLLFRPRDVR
jgi:hypothetical protein